MIIGMIFFFWVPGLILNGTHLGEIVCVRFWWFDFTCSCCLVVEKVKEKRGDWNFELLWVFSNLVSIRKLKSLLNYIN